jgi:alpha/beta superfamily hydrolase
MECKIVNKHIKYDDLFPEYGTWRTVFKYIIKKHNLTEVDIIAHSFGTVILGLLLKDKWIQTKIKKKILIEPVCFIDKSYKIYKYIDEPKEGDYGLMGKIFNNIIYKDVYLRYVGQRFLYGPEFWILDYDILKHNSLVIISEKDQVVPTDQLYERMKKHNIKCVYLKDAHHADMFMSNKFDNIFDLIDNFILDDQIQI